jgi:heme/copper-type cytochrome/quinol oxidase subunit 2
MQIDTLSYDSLDSRPLPEWLIDQKSGITTIQPEEIVMREDHSLTISFIVTGLFIILLVALISLYINKKHKNQES